MSNPLNAYSLPAPWAGGTRLPGYIYGLSTQHKGFVGDFDHDISIDVGMAVGNNESVRRLIALNASITKQIDAAWAAGTDAGGLDTGTVAADELYGLYVIGGPSVAADAIFSLALDGPALPAGYDDWRRIAYVLTDGSANLRPYFQTGTRFALADPVLDISDSTLVSGTWETAAISAPPSTLAVLSGYVQTNNNKYGALYTSLPELVTGITPALFDAVIYVETSGNQMRAAGARWSQLCNANRQISYAGGVVGGGTLTLIEIATAGWVDGRGFTDPAL